MSKIITNSSNDDYKKAVKNFSMNQRYANYEHNNRSGMMKTSIVDKNGLPKNIQRKMTGAAMANTKMSNPTFYHPLYESTNMMLPRDRRERNEWCRHFYRTEPIIATSLDLHTEFPISDFNNICSDNYIKKCFDYMAFDKINIIDLFLNI